ncbi:MAG: N-6 DNA methylase [Candidatus Zixiibacteriota bacterium]
MPPQGFRRRKTRRNTSISTIGLSQATDRLFELLQRSSNSAVDDAFSTWRNYFSRFDGNLQYNTGNKSRPSALHREFTSPDSFARYYFSLQTTLSILFRLIAARALTDRSPNEPYYANIVQAADDRHRAERYVCLEKQEFLSSCGWSNYLSDNPYGWLHTIDSASTVADILRPILGVAEKLQSPTEKSPPPILDYTQFIYQDYLDKSIRRLLGEYYTPEWLAKHVFDSLIPPEHIDDSIIDPSCGSGVFLLTALSHRLHKNPNTDISELLSGISGIDINPLAVQAARTNLLLLCADVPRSKALVELPVYCADLLTHNPVEKFDYVLGNPPWIFWNNLPPLYRNEIESLMIDYRLKATEQSSMRRLGSAGKDISTLFFYRAIDKLLKPRGKLGFVITQSVFQSTAADEFRQFTFPDGSGIRIEKVEDWRGDSPFAFDTRNKTAVVYAQKGETTKYPVPYSLMHRSNGSITEIKRFATPSDVSNPQSFWSISAHRRIMSPDSRNCPYQPRLGIETKLESVFRIHPQSTTNHGSIAVINDRRRAKIPVDSYRADIEADMIFPFVGGGGIHRWQARPMGYYIVTHTADTGMKAISEDHMQAAYPKTLSYFHHFQAQLGTRSLHRRWGAQQPYYAMYGIGPYTFAPFRVAWKRTTRDFSAVVLSTIHDDILGEKQLLANGKVMIIPFEDEAEAHFVCAVLNASVFRERINNSITSEAHRDIIRVIPWKKFDPSLHYHQKLISLSKQLHAINRQPFEDIKDQQTLEAELDLIISEYWKI